MACEREIVCGVVSARNVGKSIRNVLIQLRRAGLGHVVVVANGCTDDTVRVIHEARSHGVVRVSCLVIEQPLGPDVAKAYGTYAVLREHSQIGSIVYADGDWAGSFGPSLADFLSEGLNRGAWVQFSSAKSALPGGACGSTPGERPDLWIWRQVLTRHPEWKHLVSIDPSRSPLLVRRQTFEMLSPYWLHHPGMWTALCIRQLPPNKMHVSAQVDARILGNPTGNGEHAKRMQQTLIGDAVDGVYTLMGRRTTRQWRGECCIGYHRDRRIDLLAGWQTHIDTGRVQPFSQR